MIIPDKQQAALYLKNRFFNAFTGLTILMLIQPISLKAQNTDNSAQEIRQKITSFLQEQSAYRSVSQVAISPDGAYIIYTGSGTGGNGIYVASLKQIDKPVRLTAGGETANEGSPVWSPDGKRIAFLSDIEKKGQPQVYTVDINGTAISVAKSCSNFVGNVAQPQWSPDGKKISVLYVNNATRPPSPVAAKKMVGLIDSLSNSDIQRLAIIDLETGKSATFSPANLYIFEYDWSAGSDKIAYTASAPPGDNNWYIAKLYTQSLSANVGQVVYQPNKQIVLPRWAPDGKRLAFLEGLMSDQGVNSGEIFTIDEQGKTTPKNHTPGRKSTPTWFQWQKDGTLVFTELASGLSAVNVLNPATNAVKKLWDTQDVIRAGRGANISIASASAKPKIAFIKSSWNTLADIWVGDFAKQQQLTYYNDGIKIPQLKVENVEWDNEGFHVQGWLQYPDNYNAAKKYPLLVNAHGGPAGTGKPSYGTGIYSQLGYFVFYPNPRGSLGQGAAFTEANRRDWGYGDLRDILTGVDAVIKKANIDTNRIGLFGWSYGGSTAMFAVTQTQRFRAVVAGAGAADWASYYGQNFIDQWMKPYFGASPYDDPAAYARSSAMTFIKNVKTPTLILVGELDAESPPAQSFQFWHALRELGTPTQLVIYPDEGHGLVKKENRVDVIARSLQWFKTYMPESKN